MSDQPETAEQAGTDARARGEPATACPHPEGSAEHGQWMAGWHKPEDMEEPEELGFA